MPLYILNKNNFLSLFGTPQLPTPKQDLTIIGQKPDCSEFLVLSDTAYPQLELQSIVPSGFDFTYCQEWGLTINDAVIYRVKQDIRAKAYPSIPDQLDTLFWHGIDAWKETIQAIKDTHPK